MTATEELRRLLDERGVEHYDGTNGTLWGKDASGYRFSADELTSGRMSVHMWCETPEQAVAATLGLGTCRDLGGTGANDEQVFNCSECGCVLSLYDRDGSNNLCTSFVFDYPRYCPNCGRKVSGDGEE